MVCRWRLLRVAHLFCYLPCPPLASRRPKLAALPISLRIFDLASVVMLCLLRLLAGAEIHLQHGSTLRVCLPLLGGMDANPAVTAVAGWTVQEVVAWLRDPTGPVAQSIGEAAAAETAANAEAEDIDGQVCHPPSDVCFTLWI